MIGLSKTREHIAVLTEFALNKLWESSPDCLPGSEGCCPRCCAACYALNQLAANGELEVYLAGSPEPLDGTAWWDDERQMVDRAWLFRAWANADRLGCHSEEGR